MRSGEVDAMQMRRIRQTGRQAFTLIELMIVITIVGMVVSMVSAATEKVLGFGKKTRLICELRELSLAVETFKERYGFYPPSRFVLAEKYADYFVNGDPKRFKSKLHEDSFTCLSR